jgi:hypothetical protein
MKKLFLLLLVAVCVSYTVQSLNLIPNGDMSAWESDAALPDGYADGGSNGASNFGSFSKAADTYNGMNVIQTSFANSTQSSIRYFTIPYFEIAEAGTYVLSFYVKGKGYFRSVNLFTKDAPEVNRRSGQVNSLQPGGTTYISRPMGTANGASNLFSEWTLIADTFHVAVADEFSVAFANNNHPKDDNNPFLIAGISMEKVESPIEIDKSLKSIKLKYSSSTTDANADALPGFAPETLNYLVPVSFNYDNIPVVTVEAADPRLSISVEQPTATSGDVADRTATITASVEEEDYSQAYTVVFEKSTDFIGGFHRGSTNSTYFEFAGFGTQNYSATDTKSHGLYWGDFATRNNSDGELKVITPVPVNGADTVYFYAMDYNSSPSQDLNTSTLYVEYKNTAAPDWVIKKTIPATDMTEEWQLIACGIHDPDPAGQVQLRIAQENGQTLNSRDFIIDDVRVSAYKSTSTGLKQYASGDAVSILASGKSVKIESAESVHYDIHAAAGTLIATGTVAGKTSVPLSIPGVYVVKAGETVRKIIIK